MSNAPLEISGSPKRLVGVCEDGNSCDAGCWRDAIVSAADEAIAARRDLGG
jgi:hypothetical protein